MRQVIIAGGGLAGLAAAAALAEAGFGVDLYESRPALGGRASSFALGRAGELIDNSQHVLLRCCTSLLDFYRRLGVAGRIRFHREFRFVEPGGRVSVFRPGQGTLRSLLALMRLRFLSTADKLSLVRGLAALRRESRSPAELDRITMLDWLRGRRQTRGAIARFWRPVLVSAINEELDRMAASHGLQVFRIGLLAGAGAHEMGVPEVPLSELCEAARRLPNVAIHLRTPVERLVIAEDRVRGASVNGELRQADSYIAAVPFERIGALAPELDLDLTAFEHSPIAGIHLWFDRPVMDLPQAALLDRTIQWTFNKSGGRYVLVVVSAARGLMAMDRAEVIALALRELAEFFPRVREARLERSHLFKELRATFSARPGLEAHRPPARTRIANLFLAGDWTRTGWPATMEGAVRSGYLAAEAVAAGVRLDCPRGPA
ncbi:MAG: hydroxysqualene dehydroxylase HpnE [Acidobacteriota bacterium]